MFTGLVEAIASVRGLAKGSKSWRLSVERPPSFKDLKVGESIAVNGACLTLTELDKEAMGFDVMKETMSRTGLACIKKGDAVNLERALKAGDRLGGHFVTGHIDYTAKIKGLNCGKEGTRLEVSLPDEYRGYFVPKGSVALDGVSLTIGEVSKNTFSVYLIPYTLKNTAMPLKRKGDTVNVEADILAKIALESAGRPISKKTRSAIDAAFLKEHGFA